MRLFRVFGQKVRAHSKECAAGFREDRRRGLVYGSVGLADGSVVSWAEASVRVGFCVYCGLGIHGGLEVGR